MPGLVGTNPAITHANPRLPKDSLYRFARRVTIITRPNWPSPSMPWTSKLSSEMSSSARGEEAVGPVDEPAGEVVLTGGSSDIAKNSFPHSYG